MNYKVADIPQICLEKIAEFEKELQQLSSKEIILVAYQTEQK